MVRCCFAANIVDIPSIIGCHLFRTASPTIKWRPLEEIGVEESGEKAACCADMGGGGGEEEEILDLLPPRKTTLGLKIMRRAT